MARRLLILALALSALVGVGVGPAAQTTVAAAVTRWHVPVLMYHRVAPASQIGQDLPDLVVSPAVFSAQMTALKRRGWHTITAAQLADAMDAGAAIPPKTFVITFDDGRSDGYRYAFPILKRLGFTATFYVITGRIGRAPYLSWSQLQAMQAAGMEIGNHTVRHINLRFASRAVTDAQVVGAQEAILARLGVTPTTFAYPFGYTPINLRASVRAAGLRIAFTTLPGARETMATRLLLPRLRVHRTTTAAQLVALVAPYR